jgi:HK97 family phage major capsid protein
MNDKLIELRSHLDALRAEIAEFADADVLDEAAEARFDEAVTEFETVQADLVKLEERAAKVSAIRTAPVREQAVSPTVIVRTERNIFDLSDIRSMEPKAAKAELRARALDAIEHAPEHLSHDARETATRHAERSAGIAEHILRTGSPEYHQAFEDYITGTETGVPGAEARAAMSLTSANGGYLVPFTLDPTVILTNDGAVNPFRAISRVVTTTTNSWNGVSSAGVTAEWLAEATEAADASPTFAQPSITAQKAAAYVQASFEVAADGAGVAAEIAMLIADAKDRLEATAFATGSGSGQPKGIATVIAATTASRVAGSSGAAGAADLVAADIYAVDNAMAARHRGNAAWIGSRAVLNKVRQLATGSGPQHAFWTDFGGGLPANLIGYPVYEASAMDTTIVSGSNDDVLILGDFATGYVIVDRVGLSIAYNPLVLGANRRPSGEVGWFATWRVGGDAVNANAFRGLRL